MIRITNEGIKELTDLLDGKEPEHVAKRCDINDKKGPCRNEAVRFFEDPDYPDGTKYVCLEHEEVEKAETEEFGTILNSAGDEVELGVYACSEECRICNQ